MKVIVNNLGLFLISLALAVVVWVLAVDEANPMINRVFPRELNITVLSADASLHRIDNENPTVKLSLRGPQAVLDTLTSSQIKIIADLQGLDAGEHSVPLQVKISHPEVSVVEFSPNELNVELERLISRTLPLTWQINGEPAKGYLAATPVFSARSIELTGLESAVNAVSKIAIDIDLNGRREDYHNTFSLSARTTNGQLLDNVTLKPNQIDVSISLRQLETYRDLSVSAVVVGNVAQYYKITNIRVSPPIVTVYASDPDIFDGLPGYLETEPVDITNANDDVEVRVPLKLPNGMDFADDGSRSVLIQVGIASIESSRPVQEDVQITGLGKNLKADVSLKRLDVIVSGPLAILEKLQPADISVVVDVLDLKAGTYLLVPKVVVVPSGVKAELVVPNVQVTLVSQP
jgi:YbbR domain-containing protein